MFYNTMATDKKSFVLYADLIQNIDHLTNEEKGILFNHLLEYVNDMNPVLTDRVVLSAWKFIQSQLKRDLVKFEEVKDERSLFGSLGNLKRWNIDLYNKVKSKEITLDDAIVIAKSRKASLPDELPSPPIAKVAVNDNVNENVINNTKFLNNVLKDMSYLEITSMQTKSNPDTVIKYLKDFEAHLIRTSEQKQNLKDFKTHFTNWFNKQDIKKIVKHKKIDYGIPN